MKYTIVMSDGRVIEFIDGNIQDSNDLTRVDLLTILKTVVIANTRSEIE